MIRLGADIRMMQKDLDAKEYVKSTQYISGGGRHQDAKELGEDLSPSWATTSARIDNVYLLSELYWARLCGQTESYSREYPFVGYLLPESLLFLINDNIKRLACFVDHKSLPVPDSVDNNKQYHTSVGLFKTIYVEQCSLSGRLGLYQTFHTSGHLARVYSFTAFHLLMGLVLLVEK